ncbi:hypothetical protein [Nocardia sp. alder85J]|uniref:hypothetical protein n=1 Tax=Nocardia sp. alder85J TaxID=2862949 RepID=UPI001CD3F611|nr:hypothetical protein [Nocardia sp. alder85J]MCX4096282.1 hypothetical protein [Nocardia sp. alder85J]
MTTFTGQTVADRVLMQAHHYRTNGRLYCRIDSTNSRILLRATDVGAVTMPAVVGELVRARFRSYAAGPIFAHGERWTFLTLPHRLDSDLGTVAALNSHNAQIVPNGATLLLPSPGDPFSDCRRWIVAPQDALRPTMHTVITAFSCVVDSRQDRRESSLSMMPREIHWNAS